MTEGELNEKVAHAETRLELKFSRELSGIREEMARIAGAVGVLGSKLDDVAGSTAGLRSTVIVTTISTGIVAMLGVAALVAALIGFGGDEFGRGAAVRDVVQAEVASRLDTAITRLDAALARVEAASETGGAATTPPAGQ